MPNDPMGKGRISQGGASLTEEDFKFIAEKWDMSVEETKKNVLELLEDQLKK
jgi:hypothetical protein